MSQDKSNVGLYKAISAILVGVLLIFIVGFAASGLQEDNGDQNIGDSASDNSNDSANTEPPSGDTGSDSGTADNNSQTDITVPAPEAPKFYSYLTGLECDEESSDNIPFAFLIEPNAPLYGISSAEIVVEIPIENGKTRYLMLKNDISGLGKLGAITASRSYISQITNFFGGILVANGTDDIVSYSSIPKDLHIDLSKNPNYYYKENGRNVYTDVDKLSQLAVSLGIDTNTLKSQKLPFDFEENGTVRGKTAATTLSIPYSADIKTELKYDSASGKYLLSSSGRNKLDMLTGETASFTNVFILFADMVTYEMANGTETVVKSETSGSGYYVTNGTLTEIRWSVDGSDNLTFVTLSGEKLVVNRGNSYIGYYKASESNGVTFE